MYGEGQGQLVPPETERVKPIREIETKIVNLSDREDFERRVLAVDGRVEIPRRLIQDQAYRLRTDENAHFKEEVVFPEHMTSEPQKLQPIAEFMGLNVISSGSGFFIAERPDSLPPRSVRIRTENHRAQLTVKERRAKDPHPIDDRGELEMYLTNQFRAGELLHDIGYGTTIYQEKVRTTYLLPDGSKIDLDESPKGFIWAEVETGSREQVLKIVRALGYDDTDIAAISGSDLLRQKGVSEEELRHIAFNRE